MKTNSEDASMRMYDLIMKKRNGNSLTEEEIRYIIDGYTKGEIPDYQMSAFAMAVFFQGMTKEETLALTMSMAESGDMLDLSDIPGIKADKHSTGGVGDKTSLSVIPLVASLGIVTAKMSGRGLGHTGGTVDKLESFPGFQVELTTEQFKKQVKDIGIAIVGQSADLAPADKKLYALRDVTATVESIPLIASSIMSKKLAAGTDMIFLDVKTGNGAFMKTLEDSKALAKEMVSIGKGAGRITLATITDMNQPLGNAVGNALEVKEAIDMLKGGGPEDYRKLVIHFAKEFLLVAGMAESEEEAEAKVLEKINNGEALEKLALFVEAQGGNKEDVYDYSNLPSAKYRAEICSPKSGYVSEIACEEVGLCAMMLGGGRAKKEDVIDPAVGFVLHKKVGDYVAEGEALATMHYNFEEFPTEIVNKFLNSFSIQDEKPQLRPLIYETIK